MSVLSVIASLVSIREPGALAVGHDHHAGDHRPISAVAVIVVIIPDRHSPVHHHPHYLCLVRSPIPRAPGDRAVVVVIMIISYAITRSATTSATAAVTMIMMIIITTRITAPSRRSRRRPWS